MQKDGSKRGAKMKYITAIICLAVFSASAMGEAERYRCEDSIVEVMFSEESNVRLREGKLVCFGSVDMLDRMEDILKSLDSYTWRRISEVEETELDRLEEEGESRTGTDLYNMNNAYRLEYTGEKDIWELSEELESLPEVLSAIPVPLPQPPPTPPNYQTSQGYLNSASSTPTGIDAYYAWSQSGGDGTGVTICDLEYSWNYSHNDITKAAASQINSYVQDPFGDNNHGTAVVGIMVSDFNGWGTTGISRGASLKTCGTYYGTPTPQWNVAGAILVAVSNLSAGDVIVLEQQWEYVSGSGDYVPIEWWGNYFPNPQTNNTVYSAIKTATANGIHVMEAGGNAVNGGGVDTDLMNWYGDSGAIIVGAGGVYPGGTWPGGDLERLFYSNYGSRYTSQGWGENVVTTGYGTLYSAEGVDYYYASAFSGTSSATPIVAGAAANCVGYWMANGNPASTLNPVMLRTVLSNTGTAQVFPPSGSIGTRPNLTGAFAYLFSVGVVESEDPVGTLMMQVHPNPAQDHVTLDISAFGGFPSTAEIRVIDISGRVVDEMSIQSSESVNLIWNCCNENENRLPAGIYTVICECGQNAVSVPLVILGY